MTYSHETPTDCLDPNAANPAAIETMRAAMTLYITRLPELARQKWSHIAKARTMLRKLFRAEQEAFAAWALGMLRSNAHWQNRVLGDLGGHQALRRWERRQRLAQNTGVKPARRYRPGTAQKRASDNRAAGSNTDRFGMFRLAAISRNTPQERSRRTVGHRYSGHRASWSFDIKPIGITPDDLQGAAFGHKDTEPRENPETLWLDICQRIVLWDCEICDAETQVLCGEGQSSPKNAEAPP